MEITLENTGPNTKLLKVQIPSVTVRQAFDEFYARLAPKAKVAGFRPGKVPRAILEKNFHQEAKDEVIRHAIPHAYQEIVAEKQLQPAIPPLILKIDWKLDDSLYFEAQVDLVPSIKLPEYRGIAVEVDPVDVSDGDVEEAICHLRDKHAQLVPLTGRGLRPGDVVLLDQKISVEDQVLEESKDLTYELDEKRLSPEVYRELLDGRAGDNKEASLKIPEHYPKKEWVGKPAKISLAIKEIKEKKLPELNDDFAKDVGEYEGLNDLKGKIRENIQATKAEMTKMQAESKINEFLVRNSKMDLPLRLIERQKKHLHEIAQEKGQAPEKPDDVYWQALTARATDQLKLYFIYKLIANLQNIAPAQTEFEERIAQIARKIGQSPAVVRAYYKKDDRMEDLRERIMQDKVAEFLLSQAKIKTVPVQRGKAA